MCDSGTESVALQSTGLHKEDYKTQIVSLQVSLTNSVFPNLTALLFQAKLNFQQKNVTESEANKGKKKT